MLNASAINKQIKGEYRIIWIREKDIDYVLNGHWMIAIDLREGKYRNILGSLVGIFGFIPKVGQGYDYNFGEITKNKLNHKDFLNIPDTTIENTMMSIDIRPRDKARIFKGEDYIYVDVKYVGMIEDENRVRFFGDKKLNPIYATYKKEILMIMPIKYAGEANKYLKEIEPKEG